MYNIRASLQKYKIKKIHQKSPDRETVFNYHLNSGLTFNNHGFDTGKYDDPSVVGNKNCLYDPFSRINLGGIRIFCIFTQKFRDIQNPSPDLGIIHF
mgnify:FL=1